MKYCFYEKRKCRITINVIFFKFFARAYLSSLPLDIELLARAIRQSWSVEIMNWHLDVTFKEDANTIRNKIAIQNLNIINK